MVRLPMNSSWGLFRIVLMLTGLPVRVYLIVRKRALIA
jgi:hypothetical protein